MTPGLPDALELTRALIRFDTINPPGQERDCADYLAGMLEAGGLDVTRHEFADGRRSLVARLAGEGDGAPLCFTGHIDTVPLGHRAWSVDPFAGEVADGKLYGRGSTDMKSGVACLTLAALRLAKMPGPRAGLVLVITAGEETGCEGAAHLAAEGALGEAGAIVVGEPTSNYPLVGHKGALWLKAVTEGVTAHGSMPERGVNAVYKAARAVTRLEEFGFNAPHHDLLGAPTLNVGTVSGGINVNSVPDHAEIGIDIRSVPGLGHGGVMKQLTQYLGDDVELEAVVDVEAVATNPDDPWVRDVFAVMSGYLGEDPRPRGAPYFTDASVLTRAYGGPPTVILGPGEAHMAHQTDEYCLVERLDVAVDAYAEIARRWCGED
jgi:succinyl-diaminopimelate desuccinylase